MFIFGLLLITRFSPTDIDLLATPNASIHSYTDNQDHFLYPLFVNDTYSPISLSTAGLFDYLDEKPVSDDITPAPFESLVLKKT